MQNNPRRLDYHFKLSLSVAHNQRWVGVGLKFCSFASFLCNPPPKKTSTNIISVQMPVRRVCLEGEGKRGTLQNITPLWIWWVSFFHSRKGGKKAVKETAMFTNDNSFFLKDSETLVGLCAG